MQAIDPPAGYPPGTLLVVATPIGNLGDLSPRAQMLLEQVDVIAAEDKRHTGALLAHFAVATPMLALHEHNEHDIVPRLVKRLQNGQRIALVSDAGTPLVSDPGFVLVRAARANGLPVRVVPGPCAAVAALSVAGLPSDRFVFEGFLPARATARRARLQALAREHRTLIIHESCHRVLASVRDMADIFGVHRQICVARELTKLHEESATLPAAEVADWLVVHRHRQRGEFVLVVAGAKATPATDSRVEIDRADLLDALLEHLTVREATRMVVRLTGAKRNDVYRQALQMAGSNNT